MASESRVVYINNYLNLILSTSNSIEVRG